MTGGLGQWQRGLTVFNLCMSETGFFAFISLPEWRKLILSKKILRSMPLLKVLRNKLLCFFSFNSSFSSVSSLLSLSYFVTVVSGVAVRLNTWFRWLISIHPVVLKDTRGGRKQLLHSCQCPIKETEDQRGQRVAQILWREAVREPGFKNKALLWSHSSLYVISH